MKAEAAERAVNARKGVLPGRIRHLRAFHGGVGCGPLNSEAIAGHSGSPTQLLERASHGSYRKLIYKQALSKNGQSN